MVGLAALIAVALSGYWAWQSRSEWNDRVTDIESAGGRVFTRNLDEKAKDLVGIDTAKSEAEQGYEPSDVAVLLEKTTQVTPELLQDIVDLPNLDTLSLNDKQFVPEDLAALRAATGLEKLFLQDTATNDESLQYLKSLERLEMLNLARTRVTDRGLEHLTHLPRLKYLCLLDLPITDEGVSHLSRMRALEELELYDTEISDEGLRRLREALPKCRILK
jgi:hypothetical protein